MEWTKSLETNMELLSKNGAFLTVSDGLRTNSMTISWGFIGFAWAHPYFVVMIRPQRYTYQILQGAVDYTVSIPLDSSMKEALKFCGTNSGRDTDKPTFGKFSYANAKKTKTPIVKGNCAYYECRIKYVKALDPECLDANIKESFYEKNDEHYMVYGEVLAVY